jgi:hypothetical protein
MVPASREPLPLPPITVQQNPLSQLIEQINIAAESGLHLIAIGMAVALPAICASLPRENGRSSGDEYIEWCEAHLVGDNFEYITAKQIYSMRCGVLHSGRADITGKPGEGHLDNAASGINRVIFLPLGGATFTSCVMADAYAYSAVEFCANMGDAVLAWYDAYKDDEFVSVNINKMMQYHPDALGCSDNLIILAIA